MSVRTFEYSAETARDLAELFTELLTEEIGAENVAKAAEMNAERGWDGDTDRCATHEFFGITSRIASSFMEEAFDQLRLEIGFNCPSSIPGDDLNYDSDEERAAALAASTSLWNEAWGIAQREFFPRAAAQSPSMG